VADGSQCYISPKIIDVESDNATVRVFTWLNLYAARFQGAVAHRRVSL
jgi:hypothetical protein